MKSVYRLAVCLVVTAGIVAASGAQGAGAAKIAVSHESVDFGQVWHEEQPSMNLVVRNEGSADLKLTDVRTTCGCTVVQPARSLIPPGESTEIKVVFNTYGKQGDVSSKVIIESNDPARAQVDVPIRIFVKRVITRTPLGGVHIRSLDGEPGEIGTMRLENQMSEPMNLSLLGNSLAGVQIELKEIEPGRVYDVVARTEKPFPVGKHRGTLTLATGLEREPRMNVPVAVRVMRSVEASPTAMFMRKGDPQPKPRIVKLYYYGPGEFKVTGVSCPHEGIRIRLSPTLPPQEWMREKMDPPIMAYVQADISLPAASAIPDEGTTIEFTTNIPDAPRIPVFVTTDRDAFIRVLHGQ